MEQLSDMYFTATWNMLWWDYFHYSHFHNSPHTGKPNISPRSQEWYFAFIILNFTQPSFFFPYLKLYLPCQINITYICLLGGQTKSKPVLSVSHGSDLWLRKAGQHLLTHLSMCVYTITHTNPWFQPLVSSRLFINSHESWRKILLLLSLLPKS